MKTYEVWHLENGIDWTAYSNWFIGMNDVPFAIVIIEAKKYSNITIAHAVLGSFVGVVLHSVGCTLKNY